MKNQRHRSEFEPKRAYDQLVTDSVILSEQYVESAIKDSLNDTSDSHSAPQGLLNSLILSVLFWTLILLLFLVF